MYDISKAKTLSSLIILALRKFGDAAGQHLQAGDTDLFILYANDVIRQINYHPYRDNAEDLPDYRHEQEKRPVDNSVMVKGLAFYLAQDQASKRVGMFREDFYQHLNEWLYQDRYGKGGIQLQAVDNEDTSLRENK